MHLGFSDVPHRLVGTFLYELPFGPDRAKHHRRFERAGRRDCRAAGRLSGSLLWQPGFPIAVTAPARRGAGATGSRRRRRRSLLPENLWGWYDGRTPVTLPSGRVITPPATGPT